MTGHDPCSASSGRGGCRRSRGCRRGRGGCRGRGRRGRGRGCCRCCCRGGCGGAIGAADRVFAIGVSNGGGPGWGRPCGGTVPFDIIDHVSTRMRAGRGRQVNGIGLHCCGCHECSPSRPWKCAGAVERVFEDRKSLWALPFDRKRRRRLKLFGKSFTKNLYNFRVLSRLTFQTVSGFDFAGDPRSPAPIAAANPVHPHITRPHHVDRARWNGRRPAPRPCRDRSVP